MCVLVCELWLVASSTGSFHGGLFTTVVGYFTWCSVLRVSVFGSAGDGYSTGQHGTRRRQAKDKRKYVQCNDGGALALSIERD